MSGRTTADMARDMRVLSESHQGRERDRLIEVADRLAELDSILRDMFEDTPCSFDRHGYCQEHSWFGTETEGGRCPHARAQEVLQ